MSTFGSKSDDAFDGAAAEATVENGGVSAVNVEPTAAPEQTTPVSTLNQAVQYDVGDPSTFRPSATLHHGPQMEGESRVDYMSRLSRGGGMDRIIQ